MSELTSCNYCRLQRIKARAKKEGTNVTLLDDAKWGMGGVNVYIHPKEVKIKDISGGEDGDRKKYFACWFMALGDHCEC